MIEDSNGHHIEVVLNDKIFEEINNTKNAKEIKLILAIQRHYCIRAVDLASETSISYQDIDGLLYFHQSLVNKYVDKHREVYYAIAPSSCSEMPCVDCKHGKKVSGVLSCRCPDECQYNHVRISKYLVKEMKKSLGLKKSKMVRKAGKVNKKSQKKPKSLCREWNTNDFVNYLKYLYTQYDHLVNMPKHKIRRAVVTLKKAFDVEFEGEWEQPLKMYVDHVFKTAGDKNVIPSLRVMCERDSMQSWLDSSNKWQAQFCEDQELHCPYWKGGECVLEEDKCNQELRKKMRKAYN